MRPSLAHKRESFRPDTFWFILSDDRDSLTCIFQGNGSLLMAGIAEVNTVDLEGGGEAESLEMNTRLQPTQARPKSPGPCPEGKGRCGQGLAFPHREDLVPLPQLPTEVRRAPSQDKGDEDAFTILAPNNVEAQARGASVDDNPPRFSGNVFFPQQVLGYWRVAPRGSGGHGCGVVGAQVAAMTNLIVQVLGIR